MGVQEGAAALVTVVQAARIAGVSPAAIRSAHRRGALRAYGHRVGQRDALRFQRRAVLAYAEGRRWVRKQQGKPGPKPRVSADGAEQG